MLKLKSRQRKLAIQFIEYAISGGVYFWVGYILLDIFYYAWHWNLWWSTIASSVIGWVVNYVLQYYWVFKNPSLAEHRTRTTGRYLVITVVDWVINYLILTALRSVGITPAIGQFGSAAFFTVWNYLWYRFWVFPKPGDHLRLRANLIRFFIHRPHGPSTYRRA
ncbi:MAG TPA: GtrA family protein [Candidatus Saccharimonadales bacterium]|nr:GtrA family protein [Candidatus Saccharimonadales bacterium]